ncbi:lipoprotein-releasing ABC transporter ATP-binding protein LolD [Saccharophagus sp. K07]|jgi:lipoprotein-releasing system ATP-binding protein|uniref:lipoprotein-releasing ABC transporter ATP-binding protein LolD n=1 Tax=Saccharophagus sp. K07 TaxID=2283636 RepID=UPI001CA36DFF|nr:lipoprotein-releasing ABC transporter ATP-binding protein LolD [Saccharophagus sp. K07]MBC6907173.1 lipoprotein-releasing ABC transporter ATP-binding protein LolD [Saccharophagus sp. K07]
MSGVLYCDNIDKSYQQGPQQLQILRGLSFRVEAGQHVAIVGASGSGKSTLLNVLGGLDQPDAGVVYLKDQPFSKLSENARGKLRNQYLGFVYQFHHLLAEFTALENVAMPLLIARVAKQEALARAQHLLQKVGLEKRESHKPAQLSGGERQRVAIARALANNPACVLMDEPTGNLDGKNARAIQALMQELSEQIDTAFVVVTHDIQFARTMDSVFELDEGTLKQVEPE